jgi:hypothetical protein
VLDVLITSMLSRVVRAHVAVTAVYLATRVGLDMAGLPFSFSLDWMWLSDSRDLRDRLGETLWFFHAFPPGMNALTGVLLAMGDEHSTATVAHAVFTALGVVFVNALCYVGRACGLSTRAAAVLALAFVSSPSSIYLEYLYLYEWPVATLLCLSVALFHRGLSSGRFSAWLACFSVCAAIGFTRSTFHLAWLVGVIGLGVWLSDRNSRRTVLAAAALPALALGVLYAKNLVLFGDFAASTFGPASYTLVTVAQLPKNERDAWIADGTLSPFAALSVYAAPREYAPFFATPDDPRWPSQLTRLEHATISAPNFNHWWLLDVHRARRRDAMRYLRDRPLAYVRNVARGVLQMFHPSTTWHPRDDTSQSPHYGHRLVLGRYEAWFHAVVHGLPVQPYGLYVLVPLPVWWAWRHARALRQSRDVAARATGAVVYLCLINIAFVVLASAMLTALEWARYRYQVESLIWIVTAVGVFRMRRPRSHPPRARAPVDLTAGSLRSRRHALATPDEPAKGPPSISRRSPWLVHYVVSCLPGSGRPRVRGTGTGDPLPIGSRSSARHEHRLADVCRAHPAAPLERHPWRLHLGPGGASAIRDEPRGRLGSTQPPSRPTRASRPRWDRDQRRRPNRTRSSTDRPYQSADFALRLRSGLP